MRIFFLTLVLFLCAATISAQQIMSYNPAMLYDNVLFRVKTDTLASDSLDFEAAQIFYADRADSTHFEFINGAEGDVRHMVFYADATSPINVTFQDGVKAPSTVKTVLDSFSVMFEVRYINGSYYVNWGDLLQ